MSESMSSLYNSVWSDENINSSLLIGALSVIGWSSAYLNCFLKWNNDKIQEYCISSKMWDPIGLFMSVSFHFPDMMKMFKSLFCEGVKIAMITPRIPYMHCQTMNICHN